MRGAGPLAHRAGLGPWLRDENMGPAVVSTPSDPTLPPDQPVSRPRTNSAQRGQLCLGHPHAVHHVGNAVHRSSHLLLSAVSRRTSLTQALRFAEGDGQNSRHHIQMNLPNSGLRSLTTRRKRPTYREHDDLSGSGMSVFSKAG